ncbi:hypothetical protein TPL01_31370 [Sulfuriferula plumbiphila]|uniref:Transposase n=1 Tax=Sulfuriferula plumbiphila TaxID=171865 RepID=A0A512LBW9_9PROT|nr:hypothetical protein SFPGR_21690 [Sulfuriferula plumbiphila]GEP31999.1 hypothetical protein TPL01_31370 [Sulfuriferula plumbiphila]
MYQFSIGAPCQFTSGGDNKERRHHYHELFKAHMDPARIDKIRQATNGNYAPGHDRFKTEIERVPTRRATPGRSGQPTREVRTDG